MAKPAKKRSAKKSGAKKPRKVPKEAQAAGSTKGPASSNSNSQASTPPDSPGQPLTQEERTRYDQLKPKYSKSAPDLNERMEQIQVVIKNSKGREKRAAEEELRRLEAEFKAAQGDPQARMSETEQTEFYGLRKKLRCHEVLERDRGEKECLSSAPKEPSPAEIRDSVVATLDADKKAPELLDPELLITRLQETIQTIVMAWLDRCQGKKPEIAPWITAYGTYHRLAMDLRSWLTVKRPGMDLGGLSDELVSFGAMSAGCPALNPDLPKLRTIWAKLSASHDQLAKLTDGSKKEKVRKKTVELHAQLDEIARQSLGTQEEAIRRHFPRLKDLARNLMRCLTQIKKELCRPQKRDGDDDPTPPLTERQQYVWDVLKDRTLTANKIVEALKKEQDHETSEGNVRQTISKLRKAGYRIGRRRGRGYFRPDSLPT